MNNEQKANLLPSASLVQNGLLPAVLPHCKKPGHGQMVLRPLNKQTKEQQWCGVWYDCSHHDCYCSVLYPSADCLAANGW